MRVAALLLLVSALLLLAAAPTFAAQPPLALRPVAVGLSEPVEIAHAGDGSGRLFVVEKGGRIRIVRNGALLAEPFLNVTARVSTESERGLLGLAFHPQFAANRRFYLFYTRIADGALVIAEFLASAADPDRADAASERVVIVVPHSMHSNHNGGRITFGPDGYLYAGTGDGGSFGDPDNNGQNTLSLLGKLLRIDVDTAPGYAVPPSNPFVGLPGHAPEIWAYGLRNPWKFSFDRETGDLYIGDVGQFAWEEINFEPAGAPGGRNYGWRVREGFHCYNPSTQCSLPGHSPPIVEYGHDEQGGSSVTGGYVYHGTSIPSLRGSYVYGDFISNRVWAARFDGAWSTSVIFDPPTALSGLSSFGEDEAGELYVASINGRIYQIVAIPPTAPGVPAVRSRSGAHVDLAWSASSGNVEVVLYRVFRDGVFRATVNTPATTLSDSGLSPATVYQYTVTACDAGGNCSAQSAAMSATTLAPGQFAFHPQLEAGFNLFGNALATTLDVAALFGSQSVPRPGVTENVVSVWKWNAAAARWAFYSPQLGSLANAAYAASHHYDLLSEIGAGEGYWVNTTAAMSLPEQTGPPFNWNAASFAALLPGFNLVSHAAAVTPTQFNSDVNGNLASLWTWDAALGKWYFHSPILEASGGLPAVKGYADTHGYLHFQDYNKTLGIGAGFWVNRP